jgi:peptide/nickel transport system permease protein
VPCVDASAEQVFDTIGAGLRFTRRTRMIAGVVLAVIVLTAVVATAAVLPEEGLRTSLTQASEAPSLEHPFGTDWVGRDMLTRTLKGLTRSLVIGVVASLVSAVIGLFLGLLAATAGPRVDGVVTFLVDSMMSVPHLILLILISFALGGGTVGVVVAVASTHWTSLTRVIRAEVLQLRLSEYVQVSRKMGRSRVWIAAHHMLPHLIPQFLIGLVLLFPHAIIHEAALTFLGFGLAPHLPAIGVILAESMRYLSLGMWWLAVLPGVVLLVAVMAFDALGEGVRDLIDPRTVQE